MQNRITFRSGFVAAALVTSALLMALPAQAQRSVTASRDGGGPFQAAPVPMLGVCDVANLRGNADLCSGFKPYAESAAEVSALAGVGGFGAGNWSVFTDSELATDAGSTNTLFNATSIERVVPGGLDVGELAFNADVIGSFVIVLSGRWTESIELGPNLVVQRVRPWSGYYLYDDAWIKGQPDPLVGTYRSMLMFLQTPATGQRIETVSLHLFEPSTSPVPEAGTAATLAAGLLMVAGIAARRRRQR